MLFCVLKRRYVCLEKSLCEEVHCGMRMLELQLKGMLTREANVAHAAGVFSFVYVLCVEEAMCTFCEGPLHTLCSACPCHCTKSSNVHTCIPSSQVTAQRASPAHTTHSLLGILHAQS